MRDPYLIPRPQAFPATYPCQQTTRSQSKLTVVHAHRAWLDAEGNGVTDITLSHFHRIIAGRLMPDPSDGHEHGLTNIPCGAGI